MQNATPLAVAVLMAELVPAAAFGLGAERMTRTIRRWPAVGRILAPAVLVVPYAVLAVAGHIFRWEWCALYAALPVAMAFMESQASTADPKERGNWRDALILLALGLAVDLRWFDAAWPAGLRGLGNLLLMDAGLYAFLGVRGLSGTGFDFHFRWADWKTGLRELLLFAPAVLILGITLGFIHPHANVPSIAKALLAWGAESAGGGRWWSRPCYSDSRTSTKETRWGSSSTGAMSCSRRSREFSTAAPGMRTGGCRHRPSHTPGSTGYGRGGFE